MSKLTLKKLAKLEWQEVYTSALLETQELKYYAAADCPGLLVCHHRRGTRPVTSSYIVNERSTTSAAQAVKWVNLELGAD